MNFVVNDVQTTKTKSFATFPSVPLCTMMRSSYFEFYDDDNFIWNFKFPSFIIHSIIEKLVE